MKPKSTKANWRLRGWGARSATPPTSQDPRQEPGGGQISQQNAEFEFSELSSDRLILSYKRQI